MNNSPLLSICVSIHNTAKYLSRCLESLLKQTYSNFEIILVDNGSTDNSLKIMEDYSFKYPRIIKVFSQEDKGLSQGRQRGVNESHGIYIGFVDSDDYIEPEMYELMIDALQKEHADIVECKAIKENLIIGQTKKGLFESRDELSKYLKYGSPIPMLWSRVYKRELFISGFSPLPAFYVNNEDIFALPCLLAKSNKIFYLDIPLYHYMTDNQQGVMNSLGSNKNLVSKKIENRKKTLYAAEHFEAYLNLNSISYLPKKDLLIYKKNIIVNFLTKKIDGCSKKEKYMIVFDVFGFNSKKELYIFIKSNLSDSKIDRVIKIIGPALFLLLYRR